MEIKQNQRDYTVKELAELAGLNPSRIRQLLGKGTIKGKKRGGVWFISASEARTFLESRAE